MIQDARKIAARLSPPMRKAVLRCSEVSEWDGSGCGMSRSWPDVIYRTGIKSGYSTVTALIARGLAEKTPQNGVRLTFLGLRVRGSLVIQGWRP